MPFSSSDIGSFETNYWLNKGRRFTQHHYDDVRNHPFCPIIWPEQFSELIEDYASSAMLRLPPVPTPAELRNEFLKDCQHDWAQYLKGDGGGPFSFPHLYASDISVYLPHWIKLHLRTGWTNFGMCLPDDLSRYFLKEASLLCDGLTAHYRLTAPV